jgi:Flp pilus assembly protein TadG
MTPPMNDARWTKKPSFLARLRRDARGNTLAIVGAALVPLTAMIGSGVDLSRAYMAKTRLQSACDAASLAARRVMTSDQLTDSVRNEATRFFNFNFPQGLYETAAFTPALTRPSAGTVHIEAATTIPTVIMSMFGFDTLPLRVNCEASLNFVNTDIMLVLDVTGSMKRDVNDQNTNVDANRKITALRDAVMAMYDELTPTQTQLQAGGMRLRYGVVPYSTTVNVGSAIRAMSPAYLADNWTYPSRTPVYVKTSKTRVGTEMTSSQCAAYQQARTPATGYPATEKIVARPGSGTRRPCDVTTINYSDVHTEGSTEYWVHEPRVFTTSTYKTGGATALPTRAYGSSQTSTWNGCIEERDTVDTIDTSVDLTIPSGAHDLDINLVPNNAATRWRPQWRDAVYLPESGLLTASESNNRAFLQTASADQDSCPLAAERLKTWTRSDLSTYVQGLIPDGFTYHDAGMIWGARLISTGGIFASDNPTTFNGMPVSRHIIFMSDGQLSTNSGAYSAYGIENIDGRITGGGSDANDRHIQRFKMICNAAKGQGISVWVIAFGTSLSSSMTACASNSNQASTAGNRQQLIDKFVEIGKNIGSLRLTQ